jgi:hypothetical protein
MREFFFRVGVALPARSTADAATTPDDTPSTLTTPSKKQPLAAACLLIACKIEPGMESWRSLDAVAKAAQALRAPPPTAEGEEGDQAAAAATKDPAQLAALVAQVAAAERAVLLALNFDVRLPARGPVRWAREVCRQGKAEEQEGVGGGIEAAAAAILRDAGYTPAPLMAPPEALAKAALWLAASLVDGEEEEKKKKKAAAAAAPPGPRFAPYARVPQARAEALAAVLERTPAVVRMRAGDGAGGVVQTKKRGREEE